MKRTITARKVARKDGINTPQVFPSATATLLPGAGLCVAPVIKSKFTPLTERTNKRYKKDRNVFIKFHDVLKRKKKKRKHKLDIKLHSSLNSPFLNRTFFLTSSNINV